MPHLQQTLVFSCLRVALRWHVWQETVKFNFCYDKMRTIFAQIRIPTCHQSATFAFCKCRFCLLKVPLLAGEVALLGVFHPMEQLVPPHGTTCSTPWSNLKVAALGRDIPKKKHREDYEVLPMIMS